ncbi:MAG: hypothetical protein F6K24_17335 [Okeania sp. SIO2D1]|nr:hypothetical protein [Okeania sp. SIO2D1]NES66891.1 hypothetical protein [Okeania sp. SIO2D1]
MKPSDYCKKWVTRRHDIQPGDWGYRKRCIDELMLATGLKFTAINKWGPNLDTEANYVLRLLDYADLLNEMEQCVTEYNKIRENKAK